MGKLFILMNDLENELEGERMNWTEYYHSYVAGVKTGSGVSDMPILDWRQIFRLFIIWKDLKS